MMKQKNTVNVNSMRAWILASRPKTLSGAAMPVIVALVLSYVHCGDIRWLPALLCLLFALIMQILANFVNDYFDFRKGIDDEQRLGPRRACAEGWVTPQAMRRAIALTLCIAIIVGLPLAYTGGWPMLVVGAICIVLCFLYTLGGAAHALGDVLVLLGFGIIPVCITCFLQDPSLLLTSLPYATACGIVVDTLLVVNNYRDLPNDRRTGKRTLVVLLGKRRSEWLYLALGWVGIGIFIVVTMITQWRSPVNTSHMVACLPTILIYGMVHTITWQRMRTIGSGKALNKVLGTTSRNILIFGITLCLGLLLTLFI